MNDRRGLELSIRKLELISELGSRKLLKEQVIIKLQEDISGELLRSITDDSSHEGMRDKLSADTGQPVFHVFVCYAHKDNENPDPSKRWLDRLLEHMQPLVLQNQVRTWSDKEIEMGSFWHETIQASLQHVKAAVLLVSPAFLASKYIRNSELPILLKNVRDNGVIILPIILRPCLFDEVRFKYPSPVDGPDEVSLSSLQAANSPNEPLNGLSENKQDQVLLSVAQRLLKIVEQKPLAD